MTTQGLLTPPYEPERTWVNDRGNTVKQWSSFTISGSGYMDDRLYWDWGACSREHGWFQFDTWQDASYFGFWVNPELKQTLTYCEGDLSLVECPTAESYKAELRIAEEFYGDPPPFAISVDDDGRVTHYFDERPMPE